MYAARYQRIRLVILGTDLSFLIASNTTSSSFTRTPRQDDAPERLVIRSEEARAGHVRDHTDAAGHGHVGTIRVDGDRVRRQVRAPGQHGPGPGPRQKRAGDRL